MVLHYNGKFPADTPSLFVAVITKVKGVIRARMIALPILFVSAILEKHNWPCDRPSVYAALFYGKSTDCLRRRKPFVSYRLVA